ncbi:MAG TPA: L,D-transpeptidase [Woeseiaceae bacterium]
MVAVLMLGATVGEIAEPSAITHVSPIRLEVDKSDRVLKVYHGGQLWKSYRVAVGEPAHPTPSGDFEIDRIIWNPAWVPPDSKWAEGAKRQEPGDPENPMQGAKLFFKYPAYYIHGTNAPHTLGSAASHGCVRMDPQEVEELAEFVQDHGGEPRSAEWFETVKDQDRQSKEVTLSEPVPVTIRE